MQILHAVAILLLCISNADKE